MSIITIKSAIPEDLIDSWSSPTERIPIRQGQTVDKDLPSGISNDKNMRSCETRFITFNNHRKFYLNILDNIYPFIDFYQHAFDVQLYRVLEIQHTTYFKDDHYARHVDTIFNNKTPHQRKMRHYHLQGDDQFDYKYMLKEDDESDDDDQPDDRYDWY